MSYLCAWFFILFNIICLLSYACFKVINNIHLWVKVYKILIHPPLLVLSISNRNMEREEVLGRIEALENYFDLEDIEEDKKVKVEKEKLRGISLAWWTIL